MTFKDVEEAPFINDTANLLLAHVQELSFEYIYIHRGNKDELKEPIIARFNSNSTELDFCGIDDLTTESDNITIDSLFSDYRKAASDKVPFYVTIGGKVYKRIRIKGFMSTLWMDQIIEFKKRIIKN